MNISIRRRDLGLAAAGWCSGCAGPIAAAPSADSDDARTYRDLRQIRGHFDGGRWGDDIDRWQGRKHLAMQNLAGELLRAHASVEVLRNTMGEPDAVLEPGQPAHARALEQVQWLPKAATPDSAKRTRLWLYQWRGRHDQLLLALERGNVVAAGWLLDGE